MPILTDEQTRQLYHYAQRLREKLAVEVNQGALRDTRELSALRALLDDVREAFGPQPGPPAGTPERRRAQR